MQFRVFESALAGIRTRRMSGPRSWRQGMCASSSVEVFIHSDGITTKLMADSCRGRRGLRFEGGTRQRLATTVIWLTADVLRGMALPLALLRRSRVRTNS